MIVGKVQRALQAYLRTAITAAIAESLGITDARQQVVRGIAASDLKLPRVVCHCQVGRHDPITSGNWRVTAAVEWIESAAALLEAVQKGENPVSEDDAPAASEDLHLERAGTLFNLIMTDSIAADLSAALDDFTCFQMVPQEQGYSLDQGDPAKMSWRGYLQFELEVCGSDVT